MRIVINWSVGGAGWCNVLRWIRLIGVLGIWAGSGAAAAEQFSVGTYNLHNYLIHATEHRSGKPVRERSKVREVLLTMRADVLALQEVGSGEALEELRRSLRSGGLEYPFREMVTGYDTNIHVAVLSRFPMVRRTPHTNDYFLLLGRRFQVSRGFAQVTIQVNPGYRFTLLAAHLKSKRRVAYADEAELREKEARVLRRKVNALLAADSDRNVAVLGDLNDTPDSRSVKQVIGRGRSGLVDTRPWEHNGDRDIRSHRITWTYHYAKEDTYSRIDYILLSRGMAREWERSRTRVVEVADWGLASDHRPIMAVFEAADR